jgi:endonuclease/exonuclease/phosphatase family metal-dependent hydrolase
MRVIAWNVAHQETGRKQYENVVSESGTIPRLIVSADRLVGALVAMKADVAFLTEYRRSQSQQDDEDLELARAGFKVERTVVVPRLLPAESKKRDNQTLVAACQRKPILIVKSAAENAPEYALDNYCHVVRSGVDLVGLRIPAYQGSTKEIVAQNETHWQWLDRTLKPLVRSRSIVLGDMNRDPDSPEQSEFFIRMKDAGWQYKRPSGHPWSYRNRNKRKDGREHKGTRIDHAFFGHGFELDEVHVQYFATAGNVVLTGSDTAISDHAVLAVDVPASDDLFPWLFTHA